VAQGTSLQNLLFRMPQAGGVNTTHVGIFTENGSGGFVSDVSSPPLRKFLFGVVRDKPSPWLSIPPPFLACMCCCGPTMRSGPQRAISAVQVFRGPPIH
jgi:hypothetical protein